MTEQAGQTMDAKQVRVGRGRFRVGAVLLAGVLLVGGICLFIWAKSGGSLDQRIAAVNAAHALPPEENAATIYDRLIGLDGRTRPLGWSYPAGATAIPLLIEASKRGACWFSLSPGEECYRDHYRRQAAMDHWAAGLDSAARIDFTEDRIAEWSLRQRLARWWRELRGRDYHEGPRESYLHLLSLRRGVRVLVGLRRYCEANEGWPDRLEEIKTLVPEQALIDPFTGQPFVYTKAAEDEFYLYSKGLNGVDENGAGDDRRVWPPP